MRTTIRAAMLALLVGGSLGATAISFGLRPGAAGTAGSRTHTDQRGALEAMRPSDPRFQST